MTKLTVLVALAGLVAVTGVAQSQTVTPPTATTSPANTAAQPAATNAGAKSPLVATGLHDPGEVGMSAERLQRLRRYLSEQVSNQAIPGVVVAIARRGKTIFHEAYGVRDDESSDPMPPDAVFDLSSLSQPVVAVAAMQLHESGHWLLSDALGEILPEFGKRPISVLDLLRQTSGLAKSVNVGPAPTERRSAVVRHSLQAAANFTGKNFIRALARSNPARPSGQATALDFSYDALGLAIEQVTGQTLGAVLLKQIFIPLDLWDSGFYPAAKAAARLVRPPANAGLEAQQITGWAPARDLNSRISFECGGACLSSTAGDYLRFVQMLLNRGELEGKRILSRTSVQFMVTNRLNGATENLIGAPEDLRERGGSEFGYGLGVTVRKASQPNALPGSVGEFSVAAPTGPYFWADPAERLAVVMLVLVPDPQRRLRLQRHLRALVRQAIID